MIWHEDEDDETPLTDVEKAEIAEAVGILSWCNRGGLSVLRKSGDMLTCEGCGETHPWAEMRDKLNIRMPKK